MLETKSSYKIHTYGCKVNTYDTGLLQKRLDAHGFQIADKPRVHILNTCAVTAEATKEALKQIRRIKAKEPHSTVVVTGCAAQVDTDKFQVPGADLVVANSHKGEIENIISDYFKGKLSKKVFHSNIFKKEDLESGGGIEKGHTRAFLKIQDGCNSFCTYCVIPFARGKSRSIPIPKLVDRVQELYDQGVRELVLTGVHIGDYASRKDHKDLLTAARGRKAPEKYHYLEDLVESILKQTNMPRIRLSSLEPPELSDRLLELYQEEAMCPHFHMSIQSANTKVLKDMKRNYDAHQVESALQRIEKYIPGAFVGMDVIVGFPGESEEEFSNTFDRLSATPWTRIHVFPYSDRPGTKANDYAQKLPLQEIQRRAHLLRSLSKERYAQKAVEQVGKTKSALLLKKYKNPQAITRDYWTVHLDAVKGLNQLSDLCEHKIKILGYDTSMKSRMDGVLRGQIVKEKRM